MRRVRRGAGAALAVLLAANPPLPPTNASSSPLSAGRALMDFSFHMATGNMDEAYKAVKLVGNPSVWANM